MCSLHSKKIHTPCDYEPLPGRAALLRSLQVKAARQRRPTSVVTRFMGSLLSKFYTPCDLEPRIAEFIPLQRRHVQEHRNNSNAFEEVTLKRHGCRDPLARYMGSLHSKKIHTLCAHESLLGRASLLHSPNRKAARQRRPTDIVTRFLGSLPSSISAL